MKEEVKKDFKKADERFDRIIKEQESNIRMKKKIFMKISDVDYDDAMWFKKFSDENTDGKQFYGIKVIRSVMERLDPFLKNFITQINDLNDRLNELESMISEKPEKPRVNLPKTQGGNKK